MVLLLFSEFYVLSETFVFVCKASISGKENKKCDLDHYFYNF